MRALKFNKAFIAILAKYSNYKNVFSVKNIAKLLKYNKINNYAINLKKGKQLFFGPIYSLELVKLETLKTYIKINLICDLFDFLNFLIESPFFLIGSQIKVSTFE